MGPIKRGALGLLAILAALTACRFDGLAFREDRAFRVTKPESRATVDPPVILEWTRPSAPEAARATRFAVLVDRSPQPPGKTVDYVFRNDRACLDAKACRSQNFLNSRGIYLSADSSYRLPTIGRRLDAPKGLEDLHEVSIVPLDERGRRIGGSSAFVEFRVRFKGG